MAIEHETRIDLDGQFDGSLKVVPTVGDPFWPRRENDVSCEHHGLPTIAT